MRKCYESWKQYNPEWEVIFLEENNSKDHITFSVPEEKLCQFPKTKQSDLVRLELLSKYGGVWADATSLCRVPLDKWLGDYTQAGFFAFIYKIRGYGWIFNWFFAVEKSNPIIVKINQKLTSFYRDHEFYHSGTTIELSLNKEKK
ncbi:MULTISPECIES: capsular polysaccharide synthesis protein [unclassified Okeania]|uniref:glycosyltransferase family 32 protein n=1 Tax=unclassified Okeania TaxID=2634635 RepID=UPI00144FD3B4|nr:hypothetical protein [Okeania sp. SIO1F9]